MDKVDQKIHDDFQAMGAQFTTNIKKKIDVTPKVTSKAVLEMETKMREREEKRNEEDRGNRNYDKSGYSK